MKPYACARVPEDDVAEMVLDSGTTIQGEPGQKDGWDAWIFRFPVGTPNGNGAGLNVTGGGLSPIHLHAVLWHTDTPTRRLGDWADFPVDFFVREPLPFVGSSLPNLRVSGQFVQQEDGTRITLVGATKFHLHGKALAEGRDSIRPTLAQMQAFRYTVANIFTRYNLEHAAIGRCMLEEHPDLYEKLPDTVNMAAEEYGIYTLLIAYSSWNAPDHWARLLEAAGKCRTLPLISLVNELNQPANTTDPLGRTLFVDGAGRTWIDDHGVRTELHRPTGLVSSHGSNGSAFLEDVEGVTPHWDFAETHWNATFQWWRKSGHNSMEMADRIQKPIYASEHPRCIDNFKNVATLRGAAEGISLLIAGGAFHSVSGKRGLPWAPGAEEDHALAWADGMNKIPAECQPFPYAHRDGLEPDFWNEQGRVYQRGTQPICIARIPPENFSPAPIPPDPGPGPGPIPPIPPGPVEPIPPIPIPPIPIPPIPEPPLPPKPMRTGFTFGYGFTARDWIPGTPSYVGPWLEQPWTDHGRIKWEPDDPETLANLYYEAGVLAHVQYLAPVLRGDWDPSWTKFAANMPGIVQRFDWSYTWARPTWAPFIDTAGVNQTLNGPADLGSIPDADRLWDRMIKPFFDAFGPLGLEKTPNGRVLMVWWSLHPAVVQGTNHDKAQVWLDRISDQMKAYGLGEADHIVDTSWPSVSCYGRHGWHNVNPGRSVLTHHGVTTGVAVPGFHDYAGSSMHRVLDRRNGAEAREALAEFRAKRCDYVLLEGLTDDIESAGWYRSEAWSKDTLYLDLVREHIAQTIERAMGGLSDRA